MLHFTRESDVRGRFFGCLAAAVLAFDGYACAGLADAAPNVVIVLADDQGWGDLGDSGNRDIATPHIDSLARDGATLERFFVCPVCAPTRAEFLTGRYHPRTGVNGVSRGAERMDLDETTMADVFKRAGYTTGAFGKWHNGTQYPYHPRGRGFDEYYGFCSGHWGHYFSPTLEHNGKYVQGNGYVTDDFTDRSIAFMEEAVHKRQPFFCYLAYCTPHSPMQVPDEYYQKFAGGQLKMKYDGKHGSASPHTRAALAMCENIDANVGRVLKKLDDLGIADGTIVVYFSDNGPNGRRWNGGMRGRKGSTDEGGVRVPCFVRYPGNEGDGGVTAGATIERIAGGIDLLPTLADLAGIPLGETKPLDGKSLKPLLTGGSSDWPNRLLFHAWRGNLSVRSQQYRLDCRGRLYDMQADPGQTRDIAQEQPGVHAKLLLAAKAWRAKMARESPPNGDSEFSVGYPEFPVTQLPARDGNATGKIERSSRHPNCSFFRNWVNEDDVISWEMRVETSGRYEAVVHYTCPAADVGSTVELTDGKSAARTKVSQAHDPPLVGAAQDRSQRSESLVKPFRPLALGVLQLEKGSARLTLRAVDVPGNQVMEVQGIQLTLLEE